MSRMLKVWSERLNSEVLTESSIIHFKSKVLGRWSRTSLTDKELLKSTLCALPPKNITSEQKTKGIEYLTRKLFTRQGKVRNDKFTRAVENDDFIEAVKKYVDFRFVGYAIVRDNGFMKQYNPIYRLITNDGQYFDYTMTINLYIDIIDEGHINNASQLCEIKHANNCEWR
jgi:hypothetical protein